MNPDHSSLPRLAQQHSLTTSFIAQPTEHEVLTDKILIEYYNRRNALAGGGVSFGPFNSRAQAAIGVLTSYAQDHLNEHADDATGEIDFLATNGAIVYSSDKSTRLLYSILVKATDPSGQHYLLTPHGIIATECSELPAYTHITLEAGKCRADGGLKFTPLISEEEVARQRKVLSELAKSQPAEALLRDHYLTEILTDTPEISELFASRKFNDQITLQPLSGSGSTFEVKCGGKVYLAVTTHDDGVLSARITEPHPTKPGRQMVPLHVTTLAQKVRLLPANQQVVRLYLGTIKSKAAFAELSRQEQDSLEALKREFKAHSRKQFARSFPDARTNLHYIFEKQDILVEGGDTSGYSLLCHMVDGEGYSYVASSIGIHDIHGDGATGVYQGEDGSTAYIPHLSLESYHRELEQFLEAVERGAEAVLTQNSVFYGMIFNSLGSRADLSHDNLCVVSIHPNTPAEFDACICLDFGNAIFKAFIGRDKNDGLTPVVAVTQYR